MEIVNFIKTLIYAIFAFVGINYSNVEILFCLMCIDSVLGIAKAMRLGEKFVFKRLLWGMVSKLSILIIPLIIALMGKALSFDFKYFVLATMNIIVVSEGISCVTNIISIKTREKVENTDYITMLLHAIHRGLTKYVVKLLDTLKNLNDKIK